MVPARRTYQGSLICGRLSSAVWERFIGMGRGFAGQMYVCAARMSRDTDGRAAERAYGPRSTKAFAPMHVAPSFDGTTTNGPEGPASGNVLRKTPILPVLATTVSPLGEDQVPPPPWGQTNVFTSSIPGAVVVMLGAEKGTPLRANGFVVSASGLVGWTSLMARRMPETVMPPPT